MTPRLRVVGGPADGLAAVGSLLVHAVAATAVLVAGRAGPARRAAPIAYRVNLVAAPAPVDAAADDAAPATPTPPPQTAPVPGPSAPVPAPVSRQPAPASAPPRPAAPSPGAAAAPTARAAAPTATPGSGADPATIRTEGVEFPFPGYLRNLVAQVYRRWRPENGGGNLEAEAFFLVHRDGSMSGLQFTRRSGSFAFDLEAQGAIEAAARAGAFGELPAGYAADVLPVTFFFSPQAAR